MSDKSRWQRIRKWLRLTWIGLGLAFMIWQYQSFQAQGIDARILATDYKVSVTEVSDWIICSPQIRKPGTGVLFFPGGGVDPMAYVPLNRRLAESGIASVIVKLPYRFAPLDSHKEQAVQRALSMQASFREIRNWIVCGHSKGGEMAAMFAASHPDKVDALVLLGTSHPKRFSLADATFPVIKMIASEDGVAPAHKIREFAVNLPEDTRWMTIEGGNHAQFGHYGPQLGDHTATISREEQQLIVHDAILDLARNLAPEPLPPGAI